ncbi:MAG: hypothetical protein HW389_3167 [Bacteroidetes bacterium]|nr:hypothetical protein [Bacteroidota bacterium]
MGSSSKVILVGAMSLIVGVYAISLKKAEASGVEAALKHVNRVQSERLEDAAIRTAMFTFVKNGGKYSYYGTKLALGGGTYSYLMITHGTWADLSVTVTKNGVKKNITARVDKRTTGVKKGARSIHRGQWEVTKSFIER